MARLDFEHAQKKRQPIVEILRRIGIPGNWICKKVGISIVTLRHDLQRCGLGSLSKRLNTEIYKSVLKFYSYFSR